MITSLNHAINVQQRRFAQNKCGFAKAVRLYFLREFSQQYKTELHKLPNLPPE